MLLIPTGSSEPNNDVTIVEVVTDPLHDWNGDTRLTSSDEYVELQNFGDAAVDLAGWKLFFNDTSPTTLELQGTFNAKARQLVINPPGEINNNGHIALIRPDGRTAQEVRFGSWTGSRLPSADANFEHDESLSWLDRNWTRWHATPGAVNEEPRWDIRTTWTPAAVDGWISPNAAGTLSAHAIHAGVAINRLQLQRTDQNGTHVMDEVAPGEPVTVPAAAGEYRWVAPGTPWNASTSHVHIDATPPVFPADVPTVWLAENMTWKPPAADNEAGLADIQWSTDTGAESPWSNNFTVPYQWADEQLRVVPMRARDRVGNIGPWTNFSVGTDRFAPPAPNVTAHGRLVEWTDNQTRGAPVVQWHVRRIHPEGAEWIVSANTSRFEDAFDPGRVALAYEVRGRDAAGNLGPAARIIVDHPGLYPQVVGVRIAKPWWASGGQEIRFDFDRRMDTSRAPTLDLPTERIDEARWFANASTYFVALASADAWPEGNHSFTLHEANSLEGRPLRDAVTRLFQVDRTDPAAQPSTQPGWTNRRLIGVNVSDASGASLSWKLFRNGDPEPSTWNQTDVQRGEVALPDNGTWILKATAKDRAGNSAVSRWTYKMDLVAPILSVSDAQASGRQTLAVNDGESGPDWTRVNASLPEGWLLRTDPARRRILLEPSATASSGTAVVWIADHAGNQGNGSLILPRVGVVDTPTSTFVNANDTAAARLAERFANEATTSDTDPNMGPGAWWTAGLVGSSALSVPLVRRAARRRKKTPSFARRIREARSAA